VAWLADVDTYLGSENHDAVICPMPVGSGSTSTLNVVLPAPRTSCGEPSSTNVADANSPGATSSIDQDGWSSWMSSSAPARRGQIVALREQAAPPPRSRASLAGVAA
jgi:hypothetical protein